MAPLPVRAIPSHGKRPGSTFHDDLAHVLRGTAAESIFSVQSSGAAFNVRNSRRQMTRIGITILEGEFQRGEVSCQGGELGCLPVVADP